MRENTSGGQPQPKEQPKQQADEQQERPNQLGDRSGDRPAPDEPTYRIAAGVSEGILNMRSGPGQDHKLVVSIPANSRGVVVKTCRDSDDGRSRYKWCKARWRGHTGWLSSNGLIRE